MDARNLGKVYVTGADGFIGSHLVETLLEQGHEVTALCLYNSQGSYGWLQEHAAKPSKQLHLLLGDVRDPFFLDSTLRGHKTVFHLSSLIAIPYSYVAPQSYVETNITGALNVAQAALAHKVERLVHTSTSEVYGTAQFVPITEEHPLQGQSPYSASKIGADMIIDSYYRSFNLPTVTLRPFNTYGPRQSLRAVIPTVMAQMLNGQREIRLGSLTPTRDFNYVSDTVSAFLALAQHKGDSILGKTYNAGSEREISIRDLIQLIARLLDKQVQVTTEEERIRPELSEVQRLLADSTKLKAATQWAPRVPLEEGLMRLSTWMRNQSEHLRTASSYHR